MALITCKHCGSSIARDAEKCPQCGGITTQGRTMSLTMTIGAALILIYGFIVYVSETDGVSQIDVIKRLFE